MFSKPTKSFDLSYFVFNFATAVSEITRNNMCVCVTVVLLIYEVKPLCGKRQKLSLTREPKN